MMKAFLWMTGVFLVAGMAPGVAGADASLFSELDLRTLQVAPSGLHFADARAREQIVVRARDKDGYWHDITRQVVFEPANAALVAVDARGAARPLRSGKTVLVVRAGEKSIEIPVAVDDLAKTPPVSFKTEVMPVLGKAGCNTGPCHGHASGKGGFRLSLRGYDPAADYQSITRSQAGRRLNLARPQDSLLLAKPSGAVSHGGGLRFHPASELHATLEQWLAEGARPDAASPTRLERIEVWPLESTLPRPGLAQQLRVLAHYSGGAVRDVTRLAIFEPTVDGVLHVDQGGMVAAEEVGEAAVLVRFLNQMTLSRFLVIRHQPGFVYKAPRGHNFIDDHVDAKLKAIQVLPSDLADDSTFLRRVHLDLIGLPPSAADVRAFMTDKAVDKRSRIIDELLDRPEFGEQWALYWLELAGATESGDSTQRRGVWALYHWLRDVFQRNLPFDQFVRQALTAKGSQLENPAVSFARNQLGPKGEVVAQQFLGIRIQCAQCHDHPFDRWTQSDYNALGEFFVGLVRKEGPHDGSEASYYVPLERFLPWEKDKKVRLRFLDGSQVEVAAHLDRRVALADWMLGPAHKQTARAVVNRVWGKLLGRGIVEPVDDMRFSNPASNEPLLEALTDDFIRRGWDFKQLVRTIVGSRTYQTSSEATNVKDERNFSHALPRRLTAEQLLDALSLVTGVEDKFAGVPQGYRAAQVATLHTGSRFLSTFGRSTRRATPCTCERSDELSLAQVLHLLNGDSLRARINVKNSRLDKLLAGKWTDDDIVEDLFLSAWGRLPSMTERQAARETLAEAASRAEGFEDLLWAWLNSRRFYLSH